MNENILIKTEKTTFKKYIKNVIWLCALISIIAAFPLSILFEGDEFYFMLAPSYLICFAAFLLIFSLIYFLIRDNELVVTDKRIYGKGLFGKRVDLPLDSVSSNATSRFLSVVSVSSSSGKVSFFGIENRSEIYATINKLLMNRQQSNANVRSSEPTTVITHSDEADQLKKYKNLLDSGVITQEEFDAKKKQLLGL